VHHASERLDTAVTTTQQNVHPRRLYFSLSPRIVLLVPYLNYHPPWLLHPIVSMTWLDSHYNCESRYNADLD
jgi:hypothetical protein